MPRIDPPEASPFMAVFGPLAVGDMFYADTAWSIGRLADVAVGMALLSGGIGVAPAYGKVALSGATTHITGTLPIANGGTGQTSNGVAGQFAVSTGAGAALAWGYGPENMVFVDSRAGGTENGTLAQPYHTVQAAINAASSGDTVAIFPGTYAENMTMKLGVQILGLGGRSEVILTHAAGGGTVVNCQVASAYIRNCTILVTGANCLGTIGTAPATAGSLTLAEVMLTAAGDDANAIHLAGISTLKLRDCTGGQTTSTNHLVHSASQANVINIDSCGLDGLIYAESAGASLTVDNTHGYSAGFRVATANSATMVAANSKIINIYHTSSADSWFTTCSIGPSDSCVYKGGNGTIYLDTCAIRGSTYSIDHRAGTVVARSTAIEVGRAFFLGGTCFYENCDFASDFWLRAAPGATSRLVGCTFSGTGASISVDTGVTAVFASLDGNTYSGTGIVLTGTGTLTGPSSTPLLYTKTITNAQLRTLATTAVTVVPACSAGYYVNVEKGHAMLDYGGAAFTAVAAGDDLVWEYTGHTVPLTTAVAGVGFGDAAADQWRHVNAVGGFTPEAAHGVDVQIQVGEWYGGAEASTSELKIRTYVTILPMAA